MACINNLEESDTLVGNGYLVIEIGYNEYICPLGRHCKDLVDKYPFYGTINPDYYKQEVCKTIIKLMLSGI